MSGFLSRHLEFTNTAEIKTRYFAAPPWEWRENKERNHFLKRQILENIPSRTVFAVRIKTAALSIFLVSFSSERDHRAKHVTKHKRDIEERVDPMNKLLLLQRTYHRNPSHEDSCLDTPHEPSTNGYVVSSEVKGRCYMPPTASATMKAHNTGGNEEDRGAEHPADLARRSLVNVPPLQSTRRRRILIFQYHPTTSLPSAHPKSLVK